MNRIQTFFIVRNRVSKIHSEERPNPLFTSDAQGRRDLSAWFEPSGVELERFLKRKQTTAIIDQLCKSTKLKYDLIISDSGSGVFAHPLIVLLAADHLSDPSSSEIRNFFVVPRVENVIREEVFREAEGKACLLIENRRFARSILAISTKWVPFEFTNAYYIIEIDNVVKAGITIGNSTLTQRFEHHRNTYFKFELLKIFRFEDPETTTTFEEACKLGLARYNLGPGVNPELEQYECPGQDSGQVVEAFASSLLQVLGSGEEGFGREYPEKEIDAYNKFITGLLYPPNGSMGEDYWNALGTFLPKIS